MHKVWLAECISSVKSFMYVECFYVTFYWIINVSISGESTWDKPFTPAGHMSMENTLELTFLCLFLLTDQLLLLFLINTLFSSFFLDWVLVPSSWTFLLSDYVNNKLLYLGSHCQRVIIAVPASDSFLK